jgi:ribosome-binding protein aMBF1 (putative translation factor)
MNRAMKTNDELISEQLRVDPEFRAEWERTESARAAAVAMVRYQADHDLSQRELGDRLGMKQPELTRLELGEDSPSTETVMRLSARLGIELTIVVRGPDDVPGTSAKLTRGRRSS